KRLSVPVLDPLPNVALHIIKAPSVRLFLPDRTRFLCERAGVPGNVVQVSGIGPGGPSPRGILPLRFRRKAVSITITASVHLFQELLNGVPAHILNRQLV